MAVHPVVLWAQRSSETEPSKNVIFLTIQIQDPIDVKADLSAKSLKFSAKSSDKTTDYELDLEFYDEIDPEQSHKNESGNHITYVLRKKTAKAEFWPRLLKEKLKLHYVKTDFDKWVDEDEQDEQADDNDMADMMGGMGGMPGMGGMGGMGGDGPGNFDISQLLANSGAGGGAGGDFDISSLASQLGQSDADASESEEKVTEEAEDETKE